VIVSGRLKAILMGDFKDISTKQSNVIIKAQTSEDLSFIPDKSVDAVAQAYIAYQLPELDIQKCVADL